MKLQKTISKLIASIVLLIVVLIPISKIEAKKESKSINNTKENSIYLGANGEIDKNKKQTKTEKEKQYNLVLRKAIKSIKDKDGKDKDIVNKNKQLATRNIIIKKDSNNIEYKHRKDPILVETGDIITYEITIYNEGNQKAYAEKIIDQLPGTATTGLRLLTTGEVKSTTGNTYTVEYGITTNTVTFTQESGAPNPILPYNEKTLQGETIILECQVMAETNTKEATILTNIAYISEEYNLETQQTVKKTINLIYQDEKDTKQDGITYGEDIGYTANIDKQLDFSQNDKYYKGIEKNDDFEKLIILPKEFDLSLRKVITEVDGIQTEENRKITIEGLEQLEKEEKTTAEYNHVKIPVVAKKGSIITYNINIYNEASLDGIATIIKEQLPDGLKLDLRSLYTQLIDFKTQYYIITEKGNKFIVQYDEQTNTITFILDETSKVQNIEAFSRRETLDFDTLEYDCIVECIADEKSNIYLTSIANIEEEKKSDGTIITNQKGEDKDSEPYTKPNYTANQLNTLNYIGYTGNIENPSDLGQEDTHYKGEQDDDDFEKLVILPQAFDLKLVKYVDEVNGENAGKRIIKVDTSKLNKEIDGKKITTAEYEMEKNPISVKALDLVKYTFRIYNEGDIDGYATEISEEIPQGLEALMIGKDAENGIIIYSWDGTTLLDITEQIKETEMYEEVIDTNSVWGYSADTSIIKTTVLKDDLIKAYGNEENVNYADKENKIDYKEVSVILRVKEDVTPSDEPIRSEAAITSSKAVDEDGEEIINVQGQPIKDRDSKITEWTKRDSGKDYNEDKWEIYREDDEDYENIIVREFDLSLRKQVTKITRNGQDIEYTDRYAKIDTEALTRIEQEEKTIYDYYDAYNNKPKVRVGDIITYSIRVYNEGEISAYASIIAETIPSGLELVPYTDGDGSINDKYAWKQVDETSNIYETDYLSYQKDKNRGEENSTIIKGYGKSKEAYYQEVEIQCRVKENATKEDSYLSISQIAEDSDDKGNPVKDRDSNTGKEDNEQNWKIEDDLDIEILELEEFNLTLEMTYDKKEKETTHEEKEKLEAVHIGDIVVYTIRVYNDGDIDGYAQEITNDIPEYLKYLPNHEINQEFRWKMYDKRGKSTENVDRTVKVKTDYLARGENENNASINKIKALGVNKTSSNYKDVKIAFEVKDPNISGYVIENSAYISKMADESGNTTKNKETKLEEQTIENEEQIRDEGEIQTERQIRSEKDTEKVKIEYFDLALSKYLTKIIIKEDNTKQIIETGNNGNQNDIIPKVEINKNKMNNTIIKFAYTIKVTNEGDIEGYAKEIKDYLPEGLKFKVEDNPNWVDEGNGIITTKKLENVILKPKQSEELEIILTWENGKNNLGTKTNIAEISEEYNDKEVLDRNSTPDNQDRKENDIGVAKVILSIKTGEINNIYINLIIILCLTIFVGIVIIKIFVL